MPARVESAHSNKLGDEGLQYTLWEFEDGVLKSHGTYNNISTAISDFIGWDNGNIEMVVYGGPNESDMILEREIRAVEGFIRAKKNWGYHVTYTQVSDYFGICSCFDSFSSTAHFSPEIP